MRATAKLKYSASTDDGREAARICDHPDCDLAGTFRAPRDRSLEREYYWFCLEHIRAFNKAWDYFAGMDRYEIERFQRDAVTWHRPTWPIGTNPYARAAAGEFDDPFDFSAASAFGANGHTSAAAAPTGEEAKALSALDLEPGPSLQQIKTRYKQLVKKYHPDANGGDAAAEERLKHINRAYAYLMTCGYN